MKKLGMSTILLGAALAVNAQASDFQGAYAGLNVGNNTASQSSSAEKQSTYGGLRLGYGWDISSFLLGAEGFYDAHSSSYTQEAGGLDARLALPMNRFLPYIKLGVSSSKPGNSTHGGLGLEYSLTDRWAFNAEWSLDNLDINSPSYRNNNVSIGLHYLYGGASRTAAAERAAADKAAADRAAAEKAAADRAAAERAAADKAAADRAAAEKAAADRAAAEKATADRIAAEKAAAERAAALAQMTAAQRAAAEKAEAERLAAEKAAAERAAAERAAAERATAQQQVAAPAYKTVMLTKPITLEGTSFASGSALLNPSAHSQLDQVVEFANVNKEADLTITGYTDDRGDAKKNVALSAARADAVKAYLVKKGVAAERLTTKGAASANPVASNATAEGRAKNRRVEINSVLHETQKVLVQ
jgi:outer membrane protein OmpA-like peptidoglycan-associated protein